MQSWTRKLKPIIWVVLFCFSYTAVGGSNFVYAASEGRSQKLEVRSQKEGKTTAQKWTSAMEGLQAKGEGLRVEELRVKEKELKELDKELRKEFKETEKFLKDKKLPDKILQRHYDFVKQYEGNFAKLQEKLNTAISAKSTEQKVRIKDLQDFLEKVQYKPKPRLLDPNKLPHRMAPKLKPREPRMSIEHGAWSNEQEAENRGQKAVGRGQEAEEKQIQNPKSKIQNADNERLKPELQSAIRYSPSAIQNSLQSKIQNPKSKIPLYASAGFPDTFVLTQAPNEPSPTPNLPTPADLSETIDVQITPEIRQLATNTLKSNPVLIYEYVRNNFDYEPYYGSLKGSQETLWEKAGNDFDQASLLIALYRAAGIPARYVYGTIEIPIEKAMNWVGVKDPNVCADIFASNGIPVAKMIPIGGEISKLRLEHVWVEGYVDYIPSGGTVHKEGDTWIPLDSSFKLQEIQEGEDISDKIPFDKNGFLAKQQDIEIPLYFWLNQVGTYTETNFPDKKLYEFSRRKAIIPEQLEVLPCSLPYKRIEKIAVYSEIPDNIRYKISINLSSEDFFSSPLSYQIFLPELREKRLTLSYKSDLSPYNISAYLIELQPVIKVDGQEKAIGEPIGAGKDQTLTIIIYSPNQETGQIQNTIIAGEFYNLCITWPSFSSQHATNLGQRLITNIEAKGPDFLQNGFFQEDIAGDYLFILGKSYFGQVGIMDEIASSYLHLPFFKEICYANLFVEADVSYIFGLPYTMSIRGLSIDADRNIRLVVGEEEKIKEFMTISGYTSSVLEHAIWEKWYREGGISAIKAIQIAGEIGIPVYDITSSNISIVDTFNIPSLAKQNIKNAINAGNIVKCPQSSITYTGWQGVGYIIQDPDTGEGEYMITSVSGGIFLLTHPSAKPYRYYYDIEKKAIEYAKNLTGGCTDFASFAQYLANQFTDEEFKTSFFLHALYDLSVWDGLRYAEYQLWFLGLLGNTGPRKDRPKWLNTHNDAGTGSGFKLFVDPCPCWEKGGKEDGRKDHFVTNAVEPDLACIFNIVYWGCREDCLNDSMYNFFGRVFGSEIYGEIIHKNEVGSQTMRYLHE